MTYVAGKVKKEAKRQTDKVEDKFEKERERMEGRDTLDNIKRSTFIDPSKPIGATKQAFDVQRNIDQSATPLEDPGADLETPDVDAGFSTDPELQNAVRKKRRGRASRILTSRKGLSPVSEGSLARRTLLAY